MHKNEQTRFLRPAVFDQQQALAAAGGDVGVLREIIGLFLVDLPRRLSELRAAVSADDFEKVAAVAHSLRGSAAIFGCDQAVEGTLQVELLAKQGDKAALATAVRDVERTLRTLAGAVATEFLASPSSAPLGTAQHAAVLPSLPEKL